MRSIPAVVGRSRIETLVVAVWALLCVGIALVGVTTLRQIERQAMEDATENAERISRLLMGHFERTSDAIDGFITNFASDFSPQWTAEDFYWRSRELYLPASIVQITLVGADGRVIGGSIAPQVETVDLTDREHIRVHMQNEADGLHISAPVLGRLSGIWTIQFTRAIRSERGDLQGVIVASYDLADFMSFYEGLNLTGRGVVALVGLDGIVRVRSGMEVTYGEDISESDPFRRILAMREGPMRGAGWTDSIDRVGYFTTSERYPFYVRVGFDTDYIIAGLQTLRVPIWASLALLGIVLTLAMLGAIHALRREAAAIERLSQTQRLEALGKLTGGIAHDFNNLLTIVIGNLELLRRAPPERHPRHIDNALMASERGKSLTHQLLAFSRRQTLSPMIHDVNRIIVETAGMLTHTLRDDIKLDLDLAEDLWPVEIDANQLQIALINLAANARDAMPDGGSLRISTRNRPGSDEIALSMQDTGSGMDARVAAHAVEPFFTTKETGKGTGLGLAQVYGFVHQSKGQMKIESKPGRGTSVTMTFPRAAGAAAAAAMAEEAQPLPSGLKVLVVDDNPDIAALAADILADANCQARVTHSAGDASAALDEEAFDLLLSDIVMPGEMDGIALARKARERFPQMPIILMTGYSERLESGARIPGELILKPFSPQDLTAMMRRALPAAEEAPATVERRDGANAAE